ncbi:MAG: GIY-YIG nuclease family protein [Hyphomicrobiaceae bacterium]
MKVPCVYLLCNQPHGALYVGVTSDLLKRMGQHQRGTFDGHTKRRGISRLVYYEMHATMLEAIRREKLLKKWRRTWKFRIIEDMNPEWVNLFDPTTGSLADGPADAERLWGRPEQD